MAVANTLAFYYTTTITAVKNFKVHAPCGKVNDRVLQIRTRKFTFKNRKRRRNYRRQIDVFVTSARRLSTSGQVEMTFSNRILLQLAKSFYDPPIEIHKYLRPMI
jgi:hypothetical protein